jgi:hypothetical protein
MGEVWIAAVVTVGGGVIAGMGAEKKDKQDKAHQEAMTKEESRLAAQREGYSAALENFYTQKDRYERQRGLDQFRQFSTVGSFMPGYTDDAARVASPTAPDYNDFAPAEVVEQNTGKKGGGGKSLSDIHKKVRDPLGLF